jgi:hypothetical protein
MTWPVTAHASLARVQFRLTERVGRAHGGEQSLGRVGIVGCPALGQLRAAGFLLAARTASRP